MKPSMATISSNTMETLVITTSGALLLYYHPVTMVDGKLQELGHRSQQMEKVN